MIGVRSIREYRGFEYTALASNSWLTKYPPPKNVAWVYANYQIASIRRRTADGAAALAALKSTVDGAVRHPGRCRSWPTRWPPPKGCDWPG